MTPPSTGANDSIDGATLILDAVSYEQHSKGTSSLIFYKQAPLPEDLVKDSYCDEMDPYEGLTRPMPVRRIGTQVPNFHIHHDLPANVVLKLGECIGHGRSGIVFKVEPVGLASDTPNANLPPLVAKIGRQHYNKWLLREAYFYEEMKSLQGVAVPWYYGLYRARIPVASGQGFIPWLIGWGLRVFPHHDPGLDEYLNSYQERDGKDEDDRKELENNEEKLDARGGFRDQYADLVQQFEDKVQSGQRSTVVTVLILEEVGGEYLPIGGDDPRLVGSQIPKEITYAYLELSIADPPTDCCIFPIARKEVYNAYNKIHELGILHGDIKRENILTAPGQTNLPQGVDQDNIPDGKIGCNLKCRIIDFELSEKTDFTTKILNEDEGSFLKVLIDNLPGGLSIGEHNV